MIPHLIKGKSMKGVERYFTLVGRLWGWATDPSKALQFARPADARAIADAFCPTSDVAVVRRSRDSQLPPAVRCLSLAALADLIRIEWLWQGRLPTSSVPVVATLRIEVPVIGLPAKLPFEPPWSFGVSLPDNHLLIHAQQCLAKPSHDGSMYLWEVHYRISVERCEFHDFHEPAEYDG